MGQKHDIGTRKRRIAGNASTALTADDLHRMALHLVDRGLASRLILTGHTYSKDNS